MYRSLGQHCLALIALTDSCARPRASVSPRFRADSQSSSVAVSPDWHEAFPGVLSAHLSSDAWPLTPAVRVVHMLVSSHSASAFPIA